MLRHPPTSLTAAQLEARDSDAAVTLVTASAGSGKTEVLIQRVLKVLEDSDGDSFRLLCLTFTSKAAEELRARVAQRVPEDAWRVDAVTFHTFALEWLKQYGSSIGVGPDPIVFAEQRDRIELASAFVSSLTGEVLDKRVWSEAFRAVDELQTALIEPSETDDDERVAGLPLTVGEFYSAYDAALEAAGGLDFGSMLRSCVKLFDADPWVSKHVRRIYRHVLVDEAQDLSHAQYELLRRIAQLDKGGPDLFIVGDERQSITGYAGGGTAQLQRIRRELQPMELHLPHNFRCATTIVALANRIAEDLGDGLVKELPSSGAPSGEVKVRRYTNESAEAEAIAEWVDGLAADGLSRHTIHSGEDPSVRPEEIAVIARTRFALDPVQDAVARRGHRTAALAIPGSGLGSRTARGLVAALRLVVNPKDLPARRAVVEELDVPEDLSLQDALLEEGGVLGALGRALANETDLTVEWLERELGQDVESVGVPTTDLEILRTWLSKYKSQTHKSSRTLGGVLAYIARTGRAAVSEPGVRFLTVHRAKGLEFKAVALIGLTKGAFPDYRSEGDPEAAAEEVRSFYVAVTRASRSLLLTLPASRVSRRGNLWRPAASPLLRYVDAEDFEDLS